MVFVSGFSFAQAKLQQKPPLLLLQQTTKPFVLRPFAFLKTTVDTLHSKPFLSPDFYARQLGFFCKQEIKFDKVTKIPFRFRLGSVEACDRLEGKRKPY